MGRLERYIGTALLRAYLLVTFLLVILFSLIALLEELENVGDAAYGLFDALAFVGMTTPSRVLRLLPFVTLFGGALGLWQLARRSELVVLRAAGLGLSRIARTLVLPAALIGIATPVLHEFVAPALYRDALVSRDAALGRVDPLSGRGFWARRGNEIVEVDAMLHGRVPTGVRIYRLAPDAEFEEVLTADSADPDVDGSWRLVAAERREFDASGIARTTRGDARWRPWWADDRVLRVPPVDSLSFTDLRGYIAYLSSTGAPTARWELAYWRMWLLPLTALLTGLLAVPVALASERDGRTGIVVGVLAGGLVFYLVDSIVANAGLVAGLPPALVAGAAPAALAVVVALVLARVR